MNIELNSGRNHPDENISVPLTILIFFALLVILGCGGGGNDGGSGSIVSSSESSPVNPAPSDPPPSELKSVQLQWDAPTTSENGSALGDLAGYNIHYGQASHQYTSFVRIGKYTSAGISDLTTGLWCFAVQAFDTSNNQSKLSDEVCTTL